MANPINCFIHCMYEDVDSVGVENRPDITFDESFHDPPNTAANKDPTDYNGVYKYTEINFRTDSGPVISEGGVMSPINKISLPPHSKKGAGIPKVAEYYAYLYPPERLCQDFKEINFHNEQEVNYAALFSVCGAFVYFNEKMDILIINVVSFFMRNTKYKLTLDGPSEVKQTDVKHITSLGRAQSLKTEMLHECGFVAYGWQRAQETLGRSQGEGAESLYKNQDVPHGAFIFFRDDGSAVKYLVARKRPDSQEYPRGDFDSSLTDAASWFRETTHGGTLPIVRVDNIEFSYNALVESKLNVDSFLRKNTAEKRSEDANGNEGDPLLHTLREYSYFEKFGWNALHYACRFHARNAKIIKYLIEQSPESLTSKDNFHRYPLHIACDSNASEDVVKLLLKKNDDKGISPKASDIHLIHEQTKHLKLLPIHIACNRGADIGVIRALLDADEKKKTTREKTKVGRLPLHLAIGKKMSYEAIEALLKAERQCDKLIETEKGNSDKTKGKEISGIHQYFHGLLPLHIACLTGLETRIVELLIDHEPRDCNEKSFFMKTGGNEEQMEGQRSEDNDGNEMKKLPESLKFFRGFRALRMCLFMNEMDSAKLLLRREQHHYNENKNYHRDKEERAKLQDVDERTCLHLACKNNADDTLIKLMLILDPEKEATRIKDRNGFTPLHLACNQKDARKTTIQTLLDVKTKEGEKPPQKEHELLGRNPFCLAVQSQAPRDVLELLLQPKYFDIAGFTDREINELAARIKEDGTLQKALNKVLSQRLPIFILLLNALVNIAVFMMFVHGCEVIMKKEVVEDQWFGPVFWVLIGLLFLREISQWYSEGFRYLGDIQSWFELTSFGFLITSLLIFLGNYQPFHEETILVSATLILVINLIFFLRNASLPFSRFAGGLIVILWRVIPFFLVSLLLLFMFSQSLRLTLRNAKADDIKDESLSDMCAPYMVSSFKNMTEFNEQRVCFQGVLNAFLGGGILVQTHSLLEIAFGAIVLLVVLNVNIAIVSNAWEEAEDHAADMFWRGRLAFLGEISSLMDFTCCCRSGCFDKMRGWMEQVDGIEGISIQGPKCSWNTDPPYNSVWTKDEYASPGSHFVREIAKKIQKARSISSDLYWNKRLYKNRDGNNQDENDLGEDQIEEKFSFTKPAIFCYWFIRGLKFTFFFLAGIFSLGILWPKDVRLWIISLGSSYEVSGSKKKMAADDLRRQLVSAKEEMGQYREEMKQQYQDEMKLYWEEMKQCREDIQSLNRLLLSRMENNVESETTGADKQEGN